ncbi:MAG: D-fructose 1,6-bisphosphatase class 2/sedoheptulose 1,7-bisphosphatase [Microgenomates bacterium OLB23]|nr:MAG: D-fructose 1,6-bisphosphatase class 2/sedoheptulose 1,7-bisphosphatase [Microgenomates bacterium OLB23]
MPAEHQEARETAQVASSFINATNSAVDAAATLMLQYAPILPHEKIDKALKIQRTVELDNAAAAAIKGVFDGLPIGTNVDACEGKKEAGKDGEEVDVLSGHHGSLTGKQYSVILDPIEGTTAACSRKEGATSMLAFSSKNGLLPTPMLSEYITLPEGAEDGEVTYMNKLIASAEANGVLDIARGADYNIGAMAQLYNGSDKVAVVVMNRPTNQHIIEAAMRANVEVVLIEAGDLLPSLAAATGTLVNGKHIVVYGRGGDQEGRIAAAAAKAVDGFMQGQVWIASEDDKNYTRDNLPVYERDDIAPGRAEDTGVVFTALTNDSTYFGLQGRDGGYEVLQQATSVAIVHPDVAAQLRSQISADVDKTVIVTRSTSSQ